MYANVHGIAWYYGFITSFEVLRVLSVSAKGMLGITDALFPSQTSKGYSTYQVLTDLK